MGREPEAVGRREQRSTGAARMEIDNDPRERPLERPLTHLEPLRLEVVRDRQAREVWEQIVDGYHYLGVKRPAGGLLHHLLYTGGKPIGALGRKAGSLRLGVRDRFIRGDAD